MNGLHIAQTYDVSIEAYQDSFLGDRNKVQDTVFNRFLHYLEPRSTVLDLGCGLGTYAGLVRKSKAFSQVTGVDISKAMIRRARESAPGCVFHCRDFRSIRYPQNAFDAVIVASVVFHLQPEELVWLIQNIVSTLKPDGLIFMNFWSGDYSGFKRLAFADRPMMIYYYDYPYILELMRSFFFGNIGIRTYKRVLETAAGPESISDIYYLGHMLKDVRASQRLRSAVAPPMLLRVRQ